jgi:hypothetical protein
MTPHTLCAKFVSVFVPTMVLKMIKDSRRFTKGFGTSFPKAKAIQRWKGIVSVPQTSSTASGNTASMASKLDQSSGQN